MTNLQNYVEARSGMIERETKPREKGLNYIRAPKVLGQYFSDYLTCYGALTDIIKIGTNQLTFIPETEIKKVIAQSHSHGVRVALGRRAVRRRRRRRRGEANKTARAPKTEPRAVQDARERARGRVAREVSRAATARTRERRWIVGDGVRGGGGRPGRRRRLGRAAAGRGPVRDE